MLAPEHGGRFEGQIVSVNGGDGAVIATLVVDGKERQLPLAGVKEARLAFRI